MGFNETKPELYCEWCVKESGQVNNGDVSSVLEPTKLPLNRNFLKTARLEQNIGHSDPAPSIFDEMLFPRTALNQQNINDIMKEGLAKALSVSPKESLTTPTKYCQQYRGGTSMFKITKPELKNKILGGWTEKSYGAMMGEPMEFAARGETYRW